MKTNPTLYEPIKDELQKQQYLFNEEPLPEIYSLISQEVAKQEAIYAGFYQPAKGEVVETCEHQSPIYISQNTYTPDEMQRTTSLTATIPIPSPSTEVKQSVITHHQIYPTAGPIQRDCSYIPYMYSNPVPYIPLPYTPVTSHDGAPPDPVVTSSNNPAPALTLTKPFRSDRSFKFIEQTTSASGKMKRGRTDFAPSQLQILEESFSKQQYMRGVERDELAKRLKVSPKSVTIWFQNRRARMRAENRSSV